MPTGPHITVVIPTFRRPALVERAVASVQAQDYDNWDAVVSDDDDPTGFVAGLATHDPRFAVVRNPGPRGQVANLNHALRHAKGEWIKPLFDDDVLRARCLSTFAAAVTRAPDVTLVRCLARHALGTGRARVDRVGRRARLELLQAPDALVAFVRHDEDIGIPTQILLNRDAVEAGVLLADVDGITSAVDRWWYARLLETGSLLLLNEVLVDRHQDGHRTTTGSLSEAEHDAEFELLATLTVPLAPAGSVPASADLVRGLRLIRAAHRLARGHPVQAAAVASRGFGAEPLRIARGWLLRRAWPGRFEQVPRTIVEP